MMKCRGWIRALLPALVLAGCTSHAQPVDFGDVRNGAEAWKVADDVVAPAANTAAAIDAAIDISNENLINAQTQAYRARFCRVNAGKPQVVLDTKAGPIEETHRPMDVAIQGEGFFRVKIDPGHGDGYAYTRNGNFYRNDQGDVMLGLEDGYRLDPPINMPPNATKIEIEETGMVCVYIPGQIARQQVGNINLYLFSDASRLTSFGQGLYEASDASGPAVESRPGENSAGRLTQERLEGSNVDVTREKRRIDLLRKWRAAVLGE